MSFVPAGAIGRKQKQLVEVFQSAGATSPSQAKLPSELGVGGGLALRTLRSHAVLRETQGGALYLDQPSWDALRAYRRRLASVIIGLSVLGLAAIWYLRS